MVVSFSEHNILVAKELESAFVGYLYKQVFLKSYPCFTFGRVLSKPSLIGTTTTCEFIRP